MAALAAVILEMKWCNANVCVLMYCLGTNFSKVTTCRQSLQCASEVARALMWLVCAEYTTSCQRGCLLCVIEAVAYARCTGHFVEVQHGGLLWSSNLVQKWSNQHHFGVPRRTVVSAAELRPVPGDQQRWWSTSQVSSWKTLKHHAACLMGVAEAFFWRVLLQVAIVLCRPHSLVKLAGFSVYSLNLPSINSPCVQEWNLG